MIFCFCFYQSLAKIDRNAQWILQTLWKFTQKLFSWREFCLASANCTSQKIWYTCCTQRNQYQLTVTFMNGWYHHQEKWVKVTDQCSVWMSLCEKCPNTELFLVRIFPHSEWIRRDTKYLSVFTPNAGK